MCVLLLCSLNNTFCSIEPSFLDIESEREFSQEIMDQVGEKIPFCDQNRSLKGKKIKIKTLWVPLFPLVPCVPAPPHHLWSSQQPSKGHAVLILPRRTLRCMCVELQSQEVSLSIRLFTGSLSDTCTCNHTAHGMQRQQTLHRWAGHEFEASPDYIASHFVKRWGVGCRAGEIAQMVKCFSHSIKT